MTATAILLDTYIMLSRIKRALKSSPSFNRMRKALAFARFELTDVFDTYLWRARGAETTPYGFSLVGTSSSHHLAMQRGTFEPDETALFSSLFAKTDVFVDVGANIGFYTCLARSMGRHVIAVEPMDRNLSHLFQNVAANNWNDVEVFPVGLSERPGQATIYGASSTGASLIPRWAGASRLFSRTIALSTLDILSGDRFTNKRLFIKIDVEGAEYQVLLGAVKTLDMSPKPIWVVEICLDEFHPGGMNPHFEATFRLFWDHGFEAWTADAANRLISPADVARWVEAGKCDSGTINYLFSQKGE